MGIKADITIMKEKQESNTILMIDKVELAEEENSKKMGMGNITGEMIS